MLAECQKQAGSLRDGLVVPPPTSPRQPSLKGKLSFPNTAGASGHQLVSSTPGLNSDPRPLSGGLSLPQSTVWVGGQKRTCMCGVLGGEGEK